MATILKMVIDINPSEIHEVGCGEGHIFGMLASNNLVVRGCDISKDSLSIAKKNAKKHKLNIPLELMSICDLDPKRDYADTVLCCEVLEHLVDPEAAIKKLISITRKNLILSVPNEPIWHILNMLRGKYLTALGNTQGYFQHWSKKQFVDFVSKHADVIEIKTPLPWIILRCHSKS